MVPGSRVQWCAARLTNHGLLTSELGLPVDATDDDVVAAALTHWGDHTPHHLLGSFAYAVLLPDGSVSITRDALGVMPAFWTRATTTFDGARSDVMVSDSLTLLADQPGVDTSPDDEFAAAAATRVRGLRAEHTGMVGVRRVPPGCTVRVTATEATLQRWWCPEEITAERPIDIDDAATELRELLVTVMTEHLEMLRRRGGDEALAGVAAHCSGGLDSVALTFLAEPLLAEHGQRLRALLSWSPDRSFDPVAVTGVEVPFDERDILDRLGERLDVPVWFAPAVGDEATWLAALGEATYPRATVWRESWFAPAYRESSITHVLSGWGGDEFVSFNGRAANRAAVLRRDWPALRAGYRDRRRRGAGRLRALGGTLRPILPPPRRKPLARHVASDERVRATHPDILRAAEQKRHELDTAANPREVQLLLIERDHLARRIDAWHQVGLHWGFEYGYPLLDRRLVEWSLCLPPVMFRIGDHSRRVFRRAIADMVPGEVTMSTKRDPALFAMVRRYT